MPGISSQPFYHHDNWEVIFYLEDEDLEVELSSELIEITSDSENRELCLKYYDPDLVATRYAERLREKPSFKTKIVIKNTSDQWIRSLDMLGCRLIDSNLDLNSLECTLNLSYEENYRDRSGGWQYY